jgi:hypothetical protein
LGLPGKSIGGCAVSGRIEEKINEIQRHYNSIESRYFCQPGIQVIEYKKIIQKLWKLVRFLMTGKEE